MALERQRHQLRNARPGLAFMQTGNARRCLRQLFVFPLKGFIHNLIGSRLKDLAPQEAQTRTVSITRKWT
jgi:hypothetical protein